MANLPKQTGEKPKKSKLKLFLIIGGIVFLIGMIASCTGTTTPITNIEASFTEIDLMQGEEVKRNLTVSADEDFTEKDLLFKVENESVAKVTFEKISLDQMVTFKIQGVSAGETTLTVETTDGSIKTEAIKITVTAAEPETPEEQQNPTPTPSTPESTPTTPETTPTTPETPSTPVVTPKPESKPAETTKPSTGTPSTTKPTTPATPQDTTAYVYIYPTGTKYHSNSSCSRKDNAPSKIAEATAKSRGYEPCKKCH